MNIKGTIKIHVIFTLALLILSSCKKEDKFLDVKPQDKLFTISTLRDCEYLLQNERIFNYFQPTLGKASTDEYFVSESDLINLEPIYQNIYVWAKKIYSPGANDANWSDAYSRVYYANTILDALKLLHIEAEDSKRVERIRAMALFYRSYAFNSLMQIFTTPYDSATASTALGIPLKLNSNMNEIPQRSSQQECYRQIISDVLSTLMHLPIKADYITLPSQNAAYGFLARVCLAIGNYTDARLYANSALNINDTLFDYNLAEPGPAFYYFMSLSQYPVPEDIFHTIFLGDPLSSSVTRTIVDSSLYNSYEENDLRKSMFFMDYLGQKRFKGSYEFKMVLSQYEGIANDELYLIRGECAARMGDVESAISDLNKLLVKRYKKGTYIIKVTKDPLEALKLILEERRKEMPFRGTRWTDLRRLNKDPRFSVTLKRIVNGTKYILTPNDSRYAMPIPDNEIELSGIQQNNR
ncbi:RagB/SusD family nutrient uptake outer membrane protein [Chitinophaga filiformis]|uniref:RagB/SusD family nutrient uptake outer membrane protein n=1 Tax=Chitinophaga filiformis TaxID=104663 RepID=A0ABY4HXE1_CHIFI|nr:RagB/SusD family nutrient uptake outer membrane protein [Chitinophaga filiformis]UPK68055.1 RagB/SusD family nutrient uptake outer membrane protein [Chitinophaga filiformis]